MASNLKCWLQAMAKKLAVTSCSGASVASSNSLRESSKMEEYDRSAHLANGIEEDAKAANRRSPGDHEATLDSKETSHCKEDVVLDYSDVPEEVMERMVVAVIKIQAYYRGYLARRAYRALRTLVRLQIIVRDKSDTPKHGHLASKCMHTLAQLRGSLKRKQLLLTKPKSPVQQTLFITQEKCRHGGANASKSLPFSLIKI